MDLSKLSWKFIMLCVENNNSNNKNNNSDSGSDHHHSNNNNNHYDNNKDKLESLVKLWHGIFFLVM